MPLRIPHHELSPETLDALIEEFVTRDGTDLTDAPRSVDQVRRMLDAGQAVIAFDEDTESCNILLRDDAKQVMD